MGHSPDPQAVSVGQDREGRAQGPLGTDQHDPVGRWVFLGRIPSHPASGDGNHPGVQDAGARRPSGCSQLVWLPQFLLVTAMYRPAQERSCLAPRGTVEAQGGDPGSSRRGQALRTHEAELCAQRAVRFRGPLLSPGRAGACRRQKVPRPRPDHTDLRGARVGAHSRGDWLCRPGPGQQGGQQWDMSPFAGWDS